MEEDIDMSSFRLIRWGGLAAADVRREPEHDVVGGEEHPSLLVVQCIW